NTGELYVCDDNNDRVQVFNKSFPLHHEFGSSIVRNPRDINLTNDLIIVLDDYNPCMHLFNITDYSLLNSIISRGAGGQIVHSGFFTLDKQINLILTDYKKHCIIVFNISGEVIAQFGNALRSEVEFTYPRGVAIDNENRVVVVSMDKNNSLQIF
ncbi:hypothetical protein, partial [Salmonella sp. s51228]|uniref:hypothetical protein n=1 Tax=Salmonella sp. s51228 TaxID=3159652 RepID=UPI00397FEABC